MNWKLKAKIQRVVSWLPSSISYTVYYWIQRNLGGLISVDPSDGLTSGVEVWLKIQSQNIDPQGKVFFEVGTGRVPLAPMAYWLMGAGKTITVDLNPYVKKELVAEALEYIHANKALILTIFGGLVKKDRFEQLLELSYDENFKLSDMLTLCQIEYIAPGDASKVSLISNCIDFHTSYNVFEHIPKEILESILNEGKRLLKKSGLGIYRIDYSDHFSHSDFNITQINFLQYSDSEWEKYSGNRYMYMNRMRHDDFLALFESCKQNVIMCEASTCKDLKTLLDEGMLRLNERFVSKSKEILATNSSWIISKND